MLTKAVRAGAELVGHGQEPVRLPVGRPDRAGGVERQGLHAEEVVAGASEDVQARDAGVVGRHEEPEIAAAAADVRPLVDDLRHGSERVEGRVCVDGVGPGPAEVIDAALQAERRRELLRIGDLGAVFGTVGLGEGFFGEIPVVRVGQGLEEIGIDENVEEDLAVFPGVLFLPVDLDEVLVLPGVPGRLGRRVGARLADVRTAGGEQAHVDLPPVRAVDRLGQEAPLGVLGLQDLRPARDPVSARVGVLERERERPGPGRSFEAQPDALLPVGRGVPGLDTAVQAAVEPGDAGQEVDDAPDRVGTVEDRRRAPQHLDPFDVLGIDERRVGARPAVAFEPGAVDEVEHATPGQAPDGRDEGETRRAEGAHARDVLEGLVDVRRELFGERLAGDDGARRRDVDRGLGIAQSRDHDLLALLDERDERENGGLARLPPSDQERPFIEIGMDDLEFVSVGVRQVEDESAVGAGLRLDPARAMEDDRPGDRVLTRAHHLAPGPPRPRPTRRKEG